MQAEDSVTKSRLVEVSSHFLSRNLSQSRLTEVLPALHPTRRNAWHREVAMRPGFHEMRKGKVWSLFTYLGDGKGAGPVWAERVGTKGTSYLPHSAPSIIKPFYSLLCPLKVKSDINFSPPSTYCPPLPSPNKKYNPLSLYHHDCQTHKHPSPAFH